MPRTRLLWQLFPAYLIITLAALTAAGWYAGHSIETFYYERARSDLEARARLLESQILGRLRTGESGGLDALTKSLGENAKTRITVIAPSGKILGDSHEDPARMDNHADRPEIREAFAGSVGSSIRYSRTLEEKMMYLTLPLQAEDKIVGVVRTSVPITFIDRAVETIQSRIVWAGAAIAALAALVSLWFSRRITRPLEEMKQGAERFARGDLTQKIPVPESLEIGALAQTLNQMAAQLDERIRALIAHRNEADAVLAGMVEGVIAVDSEERLISMNHAAADLIGAPRESFQGRSFRDVARNPDLKRFVQMTLGSDGALEADIVLRQESERFIHLRGAALKDARNSGVGAVIVFHDVTRLRRLENMRKDFVANVSHEIKTPITAIKGFVETLQQGAADDPEDRARFLKIVARHADRLNAIIEDLLSLSRLEREPGQNPIQLEPTGLKNLLRSALQSCESKAEEHRTPIELVCEEELSAQVNPALLEQAIVNLVDNAIKYSPPEKPVTVSGSLEGSEILITVRDSGSGIASEHLPRLFERFYRVDEARSRNLGGTGLGLAIVKHISQAHGGRVTVESAVGKGSAFTIHLPRE